MPSERAPMSLTSPDSSGAGRMIRRRAQTMSIERHPDATHTFVGSLVNFNAQKSTLPAEKHRTTLQILAGVQELRGKSLYRALLIEFVATALVTFMHIAIIRVANLKIPDSQGGLVPAFHYPTTVIAIAHVFLVAFFIFAAGAGSGGHIVNTITFATTFTGHTPWVRCVLYFIVQNLGAVAGALILRAIVGWEDITAQGIGACPLGDLTPVAGMFSEFMFTFVLLFISYGVAFDPENSKLFGPIMAPLFVGITLGLNILAGAGMSTTPYAPGMTFNLCFGPAVAGGFVDANLWIYFVGPLAACILHALLYIGAPPHHQEFGSFIAPLLVAECPNLIDERRAALGKPLISDSSRV